MQRGHSIFLASQRQKKIAEKIGGTAVTDKDFERFIHSEFNGVKCSDSAKKRIFVELKGADVMREKQRTGEHSAENKEITMGMSRSVKVKRKGSAAAIAAALLLCICGGAYLLNNADKEKVSTGADQEAVISNSVSDNAEDKQDSSFEQTESIVQDNKTGDIYRENYECLSRYYEKKGYSIASLGDSIEIFDEKVGTIENEYFDIRVAAAVAHDPFYDIAVIVNPKNIEFSENNGISFSSGIHLPEWNDSGFDWSSGGLINCGDYAVGFMHCCFLQTDNEGNSVDNYKAGDEISLYILDISIDDMVVETNFNASLTLPETEGKSVLAESKTEWYTCEVEPFELNIESVSYDPAGISVDFNTTVDKETLFNSLDPAVRVFNEEGRKKDFADYDPDKNYEPLLYMTASRQPQIIDYLYFKLADHGNGNYTAFYNTAEAPVDFGSITSLIIFNKEIPIK